MMSSPKESDLTINSFLIPRARAFCGFIRLKPGIINRCYYASVVHFFILGFILTTAEVLQKHLLQYASNYKITDDQYLMQVMNNLYIADLISRILFFPIYGLLIDKIGRRKMNVLAFINVAIALSLFPLCGFCALFVDISPWLYFARIIYASGTSILILMPFIGDYVEVETKGRALSVNIVFFTIGMSLATLAASYVYISDRPAVIYLIIAPISLIIGTLYSFCLKPGTLYYRKSIRQIIPTAINYKQPQTNTIQIILRTIKRRPWVRAGFTLSFIGGLNLGILYQTHDPLNNFSHGSNGPENYILSHPYTFLIGVIATLTIQVMMDFINLLYIIYLILVLEVICCVCGLTIKDPSDDLIFTFFSSIFAICLSCIAVLCYIEARYCPRIVRGYSNGFKMAFFTLSTVITVVVVRFESLAGSLSFLLGCVTLSFVAFTLDYFIAIKKWQTKFDRKHGTDIKTLLSIEGLDQDLLEESFVEKSIIENVRLDSP